MYTSQWNGRACVLIVPMFVYQGRSVPVFIQQRFSFYFHEFSQIIKILQEISQILNLWKFEYQFLKRYFHEFSETISKFANFHKTFSTNTGTSLDRTKGSFSCQLLSYICWCIFIHNNIQIWIWGVNF